MARLKPLRVLHVPDAVGGQPQGLARAEREIGLGSVSVAFSESPFGYEPDEVLRPAGTSRLRYEARRARLIVRALREFDVIHFNFGRSLLPGRLAYRELPLLRRAGKVIAVTFQGDDVRTSESAPPWPSLQTALPESYGGELDRVRRSRIRAFARYAHIVWYLNPDLARSLPARAQFLPYAHVDPREWEPFPARERRDPLVVVHAPSDRRVKGTAHVFASVDELREQGVRIRLQVLEGIPHHETRAAVAAADIAVDQLLAGWYGGFGVEAMALGLPLVSYIRENDLGVLDDAFRRDIPVVGATPETLTSVLRSLLELSTFNLRELGSASRAFVERWHDPREIATRTASAYRAARPSSRS